ncbi:hypothetical protein SUDANB67_05635 (plasmid) [Nocardiopsis dassonvillei]
MDRHIAAFGLFILAPAVLIACGYMFAQAYF